MATTQLDSTASVYVPSWARTNAASRLSSPPPPPSAVAVNNQPRLEKPRPPSMWPALPSETASPSGLSHPAPPLSPTCSTGPQRRRGPGKPYHRGDVTTQKGGSSPVFGDAAGKPWPKSTRGGAARGRQRRSQAHSTTPSPPPPQPQPQQAAAEGSASTSWRARGGSAASSILASPAATCSSSFASSDTPSRMGCGRGRRGGGAAGGVPARLLPPPPPPGPPPPIWPAWRGAFARVATTSNAGPRAAAASITGMSAPIAWPSPLLESCRTLGRTGINAGMVSPPYSPDEPSLSRELLDFAAHASLSPCEVETRRAMLAVLQGVVDATCWPVVDVDQRNEHDNDGEDGAAEKTPVPPPRVVVYGSAALGLSLCSSDVDLTLVFATPRSAASDRAHEQDGTDASKEEAAKQKEVADATARVREQSRLRAFYSAVKAHFGDALRVQLLEDCRVPVVKLYDPRQRLAVDVHVCEEEPQQRGDEDEEEAGSHCGCHDEQNADADASPHTWTERVLSQQRQWLARHPVAAPLIVLTKAALSQWNLNRLFTGGLSSTAVYSLVHRFLAEHEMQHDNNNNDNDVHECDGAPPQKTASPCTTPPPLPALPVLTESNLLSRSAERCTQGGDLVSPGFTTTAATTSCKAAASVMSTTNFTATATTAGGATTATMSMTSSNSQSNLAWGSSVSSVCGDGDHDEDVPAAAAMTTVLVGTDASSASSAHTAHPLSLYNWMNHHCQTRYHMPSFARLLLALWMYLSNESFAMGYCIPDTFAALVRAETVSGEHATSRASSSEPHGEVPAASSASSCSESSSPSSTPPPAPAPDAQALRRSASRAFYAGPDLSAPSYLLPELLALFRHSAMTLEPFMNMPMSPVSPHSPSFHCPLSPLSTVLVEPRHNA